MSVPVLKELINHSVNHPISRANEFDIMWGFFIIKLNKSTVCQCENIGPYRTISLDLLMSFYFFNLKKIPLTIISILFDIITLILIQSRKQLITLLS